MCERCDGIPDEVIESWRNAYDEARAMVTRRFQAAIPSIENRSRLSVKQTLFLSALQEADGEIVSFEDISVKSGIPLNSLSRRLPEIRTVVQAYGFRIDTVRDSGYRLVTT